MFKFDNTHIFTGYLKQKLGSTNIPTCKIYTREFAAYLAKHGVEDPRVVESAEAIFYNKKLDRAPVRINYLRNNEVYNYYNQQGLPVDNLGKRGWIKSGSLCFDEHLFTPGLTKTLKSSGRFYDKETHEYLGEYLRFLRDYHGVNLMPLYNCFNNSLCRNINKTFTYNGKTIIFDSNDSKYRIYVIPVKLFAQYTIAIDCNQNIEMFCGLYNNHLSDLNDDKAMYLFEKTYRKVSKSIFSQPFIYDNLSVDYWKPEHEQSTRETEHGTQQYVNPLVMSRWDILKREQDLKLFLKVPATCNSSIVMLEGNYDSYNACQYKLAPTTCLKMEDCDEGSVVSNTSIEDKTIHGYRLDKWALFDYGTTDPVTFDRRRRNGSALQEEQDLTNGVIIPTIENVKEVSNDDIWDVNRNLVAPQYDEELGVCLIGTPAELAYVIKNGGKTLISSADGTSALEVTTYKITQDIYLNDPTKVDWSTGTLLDSEYVIRSWFSYLEQPNGTVNNVVSPFAGNIDGDGHTIFGLYYNRPYGDTKTYDYSGLIPILDIKGKTVIKNLGMNYCYVKSTYTKMFIGGTTAETNRADKWEYNNNHAVINFDKTLNSAALNDTVYFKPIGKLQLLEFNTGESYPFSDRLVEYLVGSAINPTDEIGDNIKRAQRVMKQNGHYFKIEGIWEDRMQKILYDYMSNSGPVEVSNNKLIDKRTGYHATLGHTNKSTLFDVLGYVDKDAEKWYSSWKIENGKAKPKDNIFNIDIYEGLYDI